MNKQKQLIEELKKGCDAKVGHQKGRFIKRTIWENRCGKKGFLCSECEDKIKLLKQGYSNTIGEVVEKINNWENKLRDNHFIITEELLIELKKSIEERE